MQPVILDNPNILTIFYFYKDTFNLPYNDIFNNPPNQCPICFADIDEYTIPNYRQFYVINNQQCKCYKNVIICQNCLFHYLLINKCFICNKYIYPCITKIRDVINFEDIQIYNKFSNYRIKKIRHYINSREYLQDAPRDSQNMTIPSLSHRNRSHVPASQPHAIVSVGGYAIHTSNRFTEYSAILCGICCNYRIIQLCATLPFLIVFGLMIASFFIIARDNY